MKCVALVGEEASHNPEEEKEVEFTEKFKKVEDIYEYYRERQEERKDPPEKLKVVVLDGKEVAYNPEEEEDPRLVRAIMEAEKEESIEVDDVDEYFENMRKEARKSKN